MTESLYNDIVTRIPDLTNAELDQELEDAAIQSEKAEMLVCCYLSAVRDRRVYEHFGFSSIQDYAFARFGFGERKTRYLVLLGRKLAHLPKLREALSGGKIGWCKASRLANFVAPDNEATWVESALSMSVQQLENRIKDGTDTLVSTLHFPLEKDLQLMWESVLEIYRRRAGSEISPLETFELMMAESIAEWGYFFVTETPETAEIEAATTDDEVETDPTCDNESETGPVFPWVEAIDTERVVQPGLFESELGAEAAFEEHPDYEAIRAFVLERDGWKCTEPSCSARKKLHVHHVQYRSRGVCHMPWNLTTVCHFHHTRIHASLIGLKGQAPHALEWTPPEMMQAALDRRHDSPSIWLGDPDVREESLEDPAELTPVVT